MKTLHRQHGTDARPAARAAASGRAVFADNRAMNRRQLGLGVAIRNSPALLQQRVLASRMGDGRPIQRAIAVGRERYSADALQALIRERFVVDPPAALDQVLTGYDFGNRRFVDLEAVIDAVDRDLRDYAFSHRRAEAAAAAESSSAAAASGGYYHAAARGGGYAPLDAEERSEVGALKGLGRRARYDAAKVSSTRSQEVAASGKGMAKSAVFIGADLVVPGAGSAASGVNAAHGVYKKHKVGKGKKELGKSVVVEGTAQALPYIAFARDLGNILKSVFAPSKWRKKQKLARARHWLAQIEEQLPQAQALHDEIAAHADASDADSLRRLRKAIDRMQQARAEILEWISTKQAHGTLPLTSGLEGYGSDEGST